MRTTNDKIARALLPVVTGAGCMITVLVAMNVIAQFGQPAPRIGDMVAFTASPEQSVEAGTRLIAQRPDQSGCTLDLNMLRHSGGSIIVESEVTRTPGGFRVHWAGEHTSTDDNCGASADLILDTHDLDILASAAGGYGVGRNRTSVGVSESGH